MTLQATASPLNTVEIPYQPVFEDCESIPVYVNDISREKVFRRKVEVALQDISNFSGTKFTFAGYSHEVPTMPYLPQKPNMDYVIIALIARAQSNIFPSDTALAAATSFHVRRNEATSHVGVIVIDRVAFRALSSSDSVVRSQMTVIRHELGHIAGFGHDTNPTVMHAQALGIFSPLRKLPWPQTEKTSRSNVSKELKCPEKY